MARLPLVIAPDPRLKTKSETVAEVNDDIRQLAADLFDTMYHERGIGLAAVQVGVLKRVLVADVDWRDDEIDPKKGTQYVLINPEILDDSGDKNVYKEGCLSFPEQYAEVTRPKKVKVKYLNLEGQQKEEQFTGLLATCIQHEIDHLNGIVFVDHISLAKRDIIIRKLQKMKKQGYFDHDHHGHVHGEHCNH